MGGMGRGREKGKASKNEKGKGKRESGSPQNFTPISLDNDTARTRARHETKRFPGWGNLAVSPSPPPPRPQPPFFLHVPWARNHEPMGPGRTAPNTLILQLGPEPIGYLRSPGTEAFAVDAKKSLPVEVLSAGCY